ncbi:MAG: hypothetical protein QXX35_05845 [Desulfurococcaceae archaeon]
MVNGLMYKYIDKSFNGDVVYTYVFPSKQINGLVFERETIPLDFPVIKEHVELDLAYLELSVLSTNTNVNWRVKVNGINVTREFKPIVYSKIGNYLFTKHLFDITSVLKTPESMKRSRVNVTFKREGGQPIIIEQISIIALVKTIEAFSTVKYYTGCLTLEPGDETSLDIGFKQKDSLLRLTCFIPNKLAELLVNIDDKKTYRINNAHGMIDETIQASDLFEINNIKLKYVESSEKYLPREICLSNLIVLSSTYSKPDLFIEELDVPSRAKSSFKARIKIVNKGSSKPDKILLVVFNKGEIISSKSIQPVEPGGEIVEELVINQPPGQHNLVFRIIWRKLARMWFTEEKKNVIID